MDHQEQNAVIGPIELIKKSWLFLKKHAVILVSISVVPFIFVAVIGTLFFLASIIQSPILMTICAILYLAAVVLGATFYPALTHTIHKLSTETDPRITIYGQYAFGFRVFWQFILLVIISFFATWGATLLFIIPGIVVIIYSLFYFFTFTIDEKRGFAALTESYSLIKGRWWTVFGRLIALLLVCFATALVYGIIISTVGTVLSFILNGVVLYAITLVLNVSLQIAIISFSAIYMYYLYVSLRSSRQHIIPSVAYKRWLMAFVVIGAITFVSYVAFVGSYISKNLDTIKSQSFIQQNSALSNK